ncbi:MAG: hypothetical protein HFE45_04300 [Oscillospiraceae bacterium]|jgi:hypothetical protein|nr:hypothetical protein [Oscillospiraceae bacterium]
MTGTIFSSLFPAALKSAEGEILARGQASVDVRQQSIEFKSDFVPLYPIGTPMIITRLLDNDEIHQFSGKVYISNKHLMRLVSVEDELLPGAEKIYCCEMSLSAKLLPPRSGLLSFLQKGKAIDITVTSVTLQQLEFLATTEKPLALGEEYLLSAQPQLPIADTLIQIRRSLPAGASTSYTCGFAALDAAGERSLQAFMTDYTQKNAKLF